MVGLRAILPCFLPLLTNSPQVIDSLDAAVGSRLFPKSVLESISNAEIRFGYTTTLWAQAQTWVKLGSLHHRPFVRHQQITQNKAAQLYLSSLDSQRVSSRPQVRVSVPAIARQVSVRILTNPGMGSG